MNPTHHDAPQWKDELSRAVDHFAREVDGACLKLGGKVAKRFHERGWHKLANFIDPPSQRPRSS